MDNEVETAPLDSTVQYWVHRIVESTRPGDGDKEDPITLAKEIVSRLK